MTDDTNQTRRFGPRVSVYREDLDHVTKYVDGLLAGASPTPVPLHVLACNEVLKRANTVFLSYPSVNGYIKQMKEDERLLNDARANPGNSMLGSASWVAAEKKRQRWVIETEIAEAIWQIDHADK